MKNLKNNDKTMEYVAPVSEVFSVCIRRGICELSGENEDLTETDGEW